MTAGLAPSARAWADEFGPDALVVAVARCEQHQHRTPAPCGECRQAVAREVRS